MSHDEAFVALGALALDAVDASERVAVLSHVADCDICRAELESLRATASSLAFAAPLAADSATGSRARIRDRLDARATAEGQARRSGESAARVSRRRREDGPGADIAQARRADSVRRRRVVTRPNGSAIAAGVLFVVTLGALVVSWSDRADLQEKLVSQPVRDHQERGISPIR